MNRKALTTSQIVLAAIVLTYWVMPDLIVGPFDDGVLAAMVLIAEVVLFVIRAVNKPTNSGPDPYNTDYQQYYQNDGYSGSTNYQQYDQNSGSDEQEEEFQFFAGCTDWDQVKTRYRELMKIYHPDAGGHEEATKTINAEYEILKKKFGH